jgi:hypothetical protein
LILRFHRAAFRISDLFCDFSFQYFSFVYRFHRAAFSILVSSARPKAHALAQKHDGWRPDNGSRPDRRRNLLQKILQNGQGRQLADDSESYLTWCLCSFVVQPLMAADFCFLLSKFPHLVYDL